MKRRDEKNSVVLKSMKKKEILRRLGKAYRHLRLILDEPRLVRYTGANEAVGEAMDNLAVVQDLIHADPTGTPEDVARAIVRKAKDMQSAEGPSKNKGTTPTKGK